MELDIKEIKQSHILKPRKDFERTFVAVKHCFVFPQLSVCPSFKNNAHKWDSLLYIMLKWAKENTFDKLK